MTEDNMTLIERIRKAGDVALTYERHHLDQARPVKALPAHDISGEFGRSSSFQALHLAFKLLLVGRHAGVAEDQSSTPFFCNSGYSFEY